VGLGLEAFYAGLAGQAALLTFYLLDDAAAAAGLRMTYSLIFAPAFMFIQGLIPLVVVRLLDRTAPARRIACLTLGWSAGMTALVALVGVIAWGLFSLGLFREVLQTSLPFFVPIAVILLGSQILEVVLVRARFVYSPSLMNSLRLAILTTEFGVQVTGVILLGVDGFVLAAYVLGLVKLVLALCLYVAAGRRADRGEHTS
jgi:hypothetical protein